MKDIYFNEKYGKLYEKSEGGKVHHWKYDDIKDRPLIYVGEAEDIIKRLKQHLDKKDNWNEAIAFISKDSNLNKAHIKYLENRFYILAKDCDRYSIDNSNVPTKSSVSEAEQAELEEFIYNAKILINALVRTPLHQITSTGGIEQSFR